MKESTTYKSMGKFLLVAAISLMGLSIAMVSCVIEEDAARVSKSENVSKQASTAMDAEVLGKKIDIIVLDENRIRLNGTEVKTKELAREISVKLGISD